MGLKQTHAVSLSLLILTLVVYFQVHTFEFVNYDDRETIVGNTHIQNGFTLAGLRWAFTSAYAANWFPVTWMSHMADFQMWGPDSGLHHLTNLLFHLADTFLLFALMKRMTSRLWESAFVAFVFALHPQHVESVAWVTERKDVLSAFFWFLTTWLYLDYVDRPGWRRYSFSLAAFALGLMSKQMLVTLPFTLLLLDYWPLKRAKSTKLLLEKVPYFVLSLAASVIAYIVQHQSGAVTSTIPLGTRLANGILSYVSYLVQFVWPSGLAVFYPYPANFPAWKIAACSALLIAISVAVIKRAYLAVGWFWYLGTLVPVIGIVQVGLQAKADRYTYIPMIGISIMLAWGVAELMERWPGSQFALKTVSGVVCLAWVAITWTQIQYWQNSVTLFEHAIAATENNFIAHLFLGAVMTEKGRPQDALRHLYASVEEKPDYADAHDTLGALLAQMKESDAAAEQFNIALRIQPNDSEAHYNLGNVRLDQGRLQDAANEFTAALRIMPEFPLAHFGLGAALINLGRIDESIVQFEEALREDSHLEAAREGLRKALSVKGRR